MNALPFHIDRTVVIEAARDTVFRFFTDDARWAKWWGAGSTIDPKVGGRVYIRHPGNVEVLGEVLEISAPGKIVFTYGYESGKPFGPGESRVTIQLEAEGAATRLSLMHEFSEENAGKEHVQGWRYQLSLFGNVVADEQHANAASLADTWFNAWADPDVAIRQQLMSDIASDDVRFRDRYSLNNGIDDLLAHITATQRFMPGIRLERRGNIRHCQGTMLADWVAVAPDGRELMQGVNVFALRADGKIVKVTGLVTPPAQPS